ncbi:DUF3306 domain-containing protein [Rubrivivax rivuli]|uniref:DUF3306 domain-containing protein n=1 Tax=Rubrivivax rivuli TaxID=1862385 RepID=A0A437RHZ1_9BURK|nr:DUF3306 domain-containing protein [Rubrivivax rivuli]RVU46361.1 DUF3306 domain-containing protein [Rubrivivax rivuli]
MADEADSNFFSRWSRRKVAVREGLPVPPMPEAPPPALARQAAPAPAAVALPAGAATADAAPPAPQPPPPPPAPTLADVAELTPQSDYTRFVAQGVTPEVKNAALKKLFTDPHFNVMDGLDIYIDDYGKPDPLPAGMLRQMVQSQALRLFADEDEAAAKAQAEAQAPLAAAAPHALSHATEADAAPSATLAEADPTPTAAADEDTAVQLQPDDDAGRAGPEPGAGQDAGRQH